MRVLLANLKLFYECRVLWLLWIPIALSVGIGFWMRSYTVNTGISVIVSSANVSASASFSGLVLVSVVGITVAALQMEVASKPFAFCLPSRQDAFRSFALLLGSTTVLIISLAWPAEETPFGLFRLRFFCIGSIAYFIGVGIGLVPKGGLIGLTFSPLLIFTSLHPWVFPLPQEYFVLPRVIPAVLLSGMIATSMWLWLGRTTLFRRRCAKPWAGFSMWSQVGREKYRWAVAANKAGYAPPTQAEGSLLRTMKRRAHSSAPRHIWGALHAWFLPGGRGRCEVASMELLSLSSAVFAWWTPSMGPVLIAIVALWPGLFVRNLPFASPLLIAGSRRERFFSTMTAIAILGCALTVTVALVFAVIEVLGLNETMGHMRAGRFDSFPHRMDAGFAVLLTALFPLSRLLEIRFSTKRAFVKLTQGALLMVLLVASAFPEWSGPTIPLTQAVLGLLLSWTLGTYGIYRIAMRSDLVRA